ncbi:hypothetical protein JTB14_030052 [Gonioctena quinquepunctata]|nr:hypothetical protein JTB14_030052 [Gonioctena quinquepunctata]
MKSVRLCLFLITNLCVFVHASNVNLGDHNGSNSAPNKISFLNSEENEDNIHDRIRSDFDQYTVVTPKVFNRIAKRRISTTVEREGTHANHIQIKLKIDGRNKILDLTLNKQLITAGFFHEKQENGTYQTHRPNIQETNLCEYAGKVRDVPNSWVALSTCEVYRDDVSIESPHFLYKPSSLADHNGSCDHGHDAKTENVGEKLSRFKRSTDGSELLRSPYNANRKSRYVELLFVIDNQLYKKYGKQQVLNRAKTLANIVNALYIPLNIFVALVGVVIWTEKDEIDLSPNGDTTLSNFLQYRRKELVGKYPNDNAVLITKKIFENGVVAKALKGPICTFQYSGSVITDYSPVLGHLAVSVAHSLGHNFGMEHDDSSCKCPEDYCIMAPSIFSIAPSQWSSCSKEYLELAFSRGMDLCLRNKPSWLFDGPVCGNGFVEPGEQCDCGLQEQCDNLCCNPATCMLRSNASCATGECCDLSNCSLKKAGTLCRSADAECDLPEYCTGQTEYCPANTFKMDTEVCDDGNAYCYQGSCETRTSQCKLLWGSTGKSSDDVCYNSNTKGVRFGNCGYNKLNQSYTKCSNEDVLCGMLHCIHLNERLEFGLESVSVLSHTFIKSHGNIIACRNAIIDLGLDQMDPGLTPNGAPCGEGKMCVNQKCLSVSSLRDEGPSCPQGCNGNGWCNNKGHCHCKNGFAPPRCDYPGLGGSIDSGPALFIPVPSDDSTTPSERSSLEDITESFSEAIDGTESTTTAEAISGIKITASLE